MPFRAFPLPSRLLFALAIAISIFLCLFNLPKSASAQEQPESLFPCAGIEGVSESECQALVAIYDSFEGSEWSDSRGWLESNQPCEWGGVFCEDGHVTGLSFLREGVSGTLPAAIGNLPYLVTLNLKGNEISGELPVEIGELSQLAYLNLSGNEFTGPLPGSIGNLYNLTELNLSSNFFTGSLPDNFWSLTALTHLYIGDNSFSGQIPVGIGNLSQLETLQIGRNYFTGSLPDEIGSLTNLVDLSITSNHLTGSLPHSIGKLTSLNSLRIANTAIGGEVPYTVVNLYNLRYLYLYANQFSGTIPYGISELENLRALDLSDNEFEGFDPYISSLPRLELLNLSYNKLSGKLPENFFVMDNIYYLDLSNNQLNWYSDEPFDMPKLDTLRLGNNQFSGKVPAQLFTLPSLYHLHLENNLFSGTLPDDLWSNTQLRTVDLSGNALNGQLPSALNSIGLNYLNLSRNQFEGQLPDSIGNMVWLRKLDLSSNGFTGQLPGAIGSLLDLRTLDLHSNHFTGEIPSSIASLVHLNEPVWDLAAPGYTDLGHNHFTATDPAVRAFLAVKDPDWESTQTYGNMPPKLVSIQPNTVTAGSADIQLKVHGSGFMNGAVVHWNGAALPTTFQSDSLLVAAVSKSRLAAPGTISITSRNPAPTVASSNAVFLYITPSKTWQTTRISVSSIGEQANGVSMTSSVSADGRFVAFDSTSTNLLPGQTSGYWRVYVLDRQTGQLEHIAVDPTTSISHHSSRPTISADGRFVVFFSTFPGISITQYQLYVYDRQTGVSELVSKSSSGEPGAGRHTSPGISVGGRYVVFSSEAANLVPDDNNDRVDVFLHDRTSGVTERISLTHLGQETYDGDSECAVISADGKYVVFHSDASDLVPEDYNGWTDVFVRDLMSQTTERVSISSSGIEGNSSSFLPEITADGRYIVFTSYATNLTPEVPANYEMVYVRDRLLGTTEVITPYTTETYSVNSWSGTVSDDGRFVAYHSDFNPDDPDEPFDYNQVYLHDRLAQKSYRLPLTWDGQPHNDYPGGPRISSDGRFIVFNSNASNLVPGDTNQRTDIYLLEHCLKGGCYPVTYHPVPVIGSLDPPSTFPGSGTLTLQVRGRNFIEGAAVFWNGEKIPTTFLASTALKVTIPAGKLVEAGTVPITVENPRPSQGPSAPFNFHISNIQPAVGSTALTRRPEFQWPAVDGAASYQVQVSIYSNFSELLMSMTSGASTIVAQSDLPLNRTIYWRARARIAGVYQPWSPRYSFRSANPPSNPSLLSPANDAATYNYLPKLTWSQSSLPAGTTFEHYQLQVSTNSSFSGELTFERFISSRGSPFYNVGVGLLQPRTYYFWRVRAINTLGQVSSWSKTFRLKAALETPVILSPAKGSTIDSLNVSINWAAVTGATAYRTYYYYTSDYKNPFGSSWVSPGPGDWYGYLNPNTVVYFQVRAEGPFGPSGWAKGSFRTANPPATPALRSPGPNSLVITTTPRLVWHPPSVPSGTNFSHYTLIIAHDFDCHDYVVKVDINSYDKPYYNVLMSDGLKPNTKYYWRVQAWNTRGQVSQWSYPRIMRTSMPKPVLISPTESSQAFTPRPTFIWSQPELHPINPPATVKNYTIQFSLASDFSTLITSGTPVGTIYTPTKDLPKNRTIYWRVRANGVFGPTPWVSSFFRSANPPSTPALSAPGSNALVTTYTPTLSWLASSLPSATTFQYYKLEVSKYPNFPEDGGKTIVKYINLRSTPYYTFGEEEALDSDAVYYWRVQAWNSDDHYSTWSPVRYFRSAMVAPVLIAPEAATTVQVRRPTFTWGAVPGAVSYTIQLSIYSSFSELLATATCKGNDCNSWNSSVSLPQNRLIHWRVRANGSNGPSLWSKGSFRSANPPSAPSLVSPASGTQVKSMEPRLDWSTSTLPTGTTFGYYQVEIATDPAFTTPIRKELSNRALSELTDWTDLGPLEPNTPYYWRVRAVNSEEHKSLWSVSWRFLTP